MKQRSLIRKMWKARLSYVFIAPDLAVFLIFIFIPVFYSFYLSLHSWNILQPQKTFVGFENYTKAFQDDIFLTSLKNTIYFVSLNVPLMLSISLIAALILNLPLKGRGLYRTLFFLPVVTSEAVAAIIFKWIYSAQYGLLNSILMSLHIIHSPIAWLAEPSLAMPAVIVVTSWKGIGYYMVIFLAGLQGIPRQLYEAAMIDGANKWHSFWNVTLPLLKPTLFFSVLIAMIGSFQVFTTVYVMTAGGPLRRTTTIVTYLYNVAFKEFRMGYASAIAYILFGIVFTAVLLQFKYFGK